MAPTTYADPTTKKRPQIDANGNPVDPTTNVGTPEPGIKQPPIDYGPGLDTTHYGPGNPTGPQVPPDEWTPQSVADFEKAHPQGWGGGFGPAMDPGGAVMPGQPGQPMDPGGAVQPAANPDGDPRRGEAPVAEDQRYPWVGQTPASPTAPTAGTPTTPTTPTGPTSNFQSQIAAAATAAWGRAPTAAELAQWSAPMDAAAAEELKRQIRISPEALTHSGAPGAPAAPTAPTTDNTDWASQDYRQEGRIRAFFVAKGLSGPVLDRVVNTWETYAREPWAAEAMGNGYFYRRMEAEEELGGGGGGTGTNAYVPTDAGHNPWTDQMRQELLRQLGVASQPVTGDDPTISQTMSGARLEEERAQEMERRALSERLFAGGDLNSNSGQQAVQQSAERTAGKMASLKGNLMQQELLSRRDTMRQLLAQAMQSGDAESARQVQIQLSNLEALLRREGYGVTLATTATTNNTGIVNTAAGH